MKIEKLKQGMIFKNYKELCKFLEMPVRDGKSKKLQIAELERYVEFHKLGNKFVIDEVLSVAAEKVDKRKDPMKKSNNALYSNDIQTLLIHLLAGSDGNTIYVPINRLLRILDIVNCNYSEAKRNIPKLAEITSIPEEYCFEFFNLNNVKLKEKLEVALRGLRRRALITYNECISICVLEAEVHYTETGDIKVNPRNKKEGSITYRRVHREATEDEAKLILHAEFTVLEEMKYINQQQVFLSGKWFEYQKRVNKKVSELANIEYYYSSYRIIYNLDDVTKVYLRQLEQKEKNEISNNLNKNITKFVIQNAKTTHKRALKKEVLNKSDAVQSSKNYIKHTETLNNIVIDKCAKDIRNELKKAVSVQQTSLFENNDNNKNIPF